VSDEKRDERDDAVAARARAHLERTSDELDAHTLARLRAARASALDPLTAPRELWPRRAALAGAGALAVFAALSWWRRGTPRDPLGEAFEDLEILAAADDLELYDDDPEFYRWLEESEPI
jgi:ferric-dicitrate binding protein FerR (iron transport regulator)